MKTKIIYILLASTMLFSSCQDWLEVNSSTQIKGDDLFKTESGFQDALTGIYLNLASQDLYGKNLTWYFVDMMAEPYFDFGLNDDETHIKQGLYTSVPCQKYINTIWNKAYTSIASINKALKYLEEEKSVLNPVSKQLFKGEMLALRAYLHLDLLRLYGYGNLSNRTDFEKRLTIPYVSEYTKDLTPQRTYAETIKLIIKDLNDAITALAEDPIRKIKPASYYDEINANGYWNNRKSHLNYFAAKAILARVYMWEGSAESLLAAYNIASELIADEGTAFSWINEKNLSSSDKSMVDYTFTSEHLFTLDAYNLASFINTALTDPIYNSSSKTNLIAESEIESSIFNKIKDMGEYDSDGNWIPNIVPDVGFDDYRLNKQIQKTIKDNTNYYYVIKLYQPNGYDLNYKDRIPLVKISEMYYIIAEYYLSQGRNDDALATINLVRSKRGLTIPVTTDLLENTWYQTVESELLKEYLREFMQEGQLLYFLKRKGLNEFGDLSVYITGAFSDARYVLPYPIDEVSIGNRVQ